MELFENIKKNKYVYISLKIYNFNDKILLSKKRVFL